MLKATTSGARKSRPDAEQAGRRREIMNGKILVVFQSPAQRREAGLLEGGGYPFKVGHLEHPAVLAQALTKVAPGLVLLYAGSDGQAAYALCQKIRNQCKDYFGLIAVAAAEAGAFERDLAIEAGADALVRFGGEDPEALVVQLAGLLRSGEVAQEYLRRSRSLARASAEAADIIVQLEEASRRIREQNDELRERDQRIRQQQAEIQRHLDTLRHELQLAASLQINLMPSGRGYSEGLDISLYDRYIPAEDLGGDYYDYVRLPDGGVFLCVADVTGHGVAPALVTVQLRALARSHLQNGQSLAAVMNDLNSFMYETFHQAYLMTMAGLVWRPGQNELEFVGAGHCPLVLASATDGECREFFSAGVPLGVLEDAGYESAAIPFQAGDRVLLYTDGITEAANSSGNEYSPERLVRLFGGLGKTPGARVLETVLKEVGEFVEGARFVDDVTLVMLERNR